MFVKIVFWPPFWFLGTNIDIVIFLVAVLYKDSDISDAN